MQTLQEKLALQSTVRGFGNVFQIVVLIFESCSTDVCSNLTVILKFSFSIASYETRSNVSKVLIIKKTFQRTMLEEILNSPHPTPGIRGQKQLRSFFSS
jgi:hypothetical protein